MYRKNSSVSTSSNKKVVRDRQYQKKQRQKRKEALDEAIAYCKWQKDKPGLEARKINERIGMGVFATKTFECGDFLLEYRGEFIKYTNALRLERLYKENRKMVYMYFFKYNSKNYCIDATHDVAGGEDSPSLGRLVNEGDGIYEPQNAAMKAIHFGNQTRLCLFATKTIMPLMEIRYDYGNPDQEWRKEREVEVTTPDDLSTCGICSVQFANRDRHAHMKSEPHVVCQRQGNGSQTVCSSIWDAEACLQIHKDNSTNCNKDWSMLPEKVQKNSGICDGSEREHTDHVKPPFTDHQKCPYCDYKSRHKGNLKVHIRTHTGAKPFSCKFCSFKCTQRNAIVDHERTHTGEKPYQCKYCRYKSRRSQDLKTHLRTHTGDKPYLCKQCKFRSTSASKLKRHYSKHTNKKSHKCKTCNREYKSTDSLRVHLKKNGCQKRS